MYKCHCNSKNVTLRSIIKPSVNLNLRCTSGDHYMDEINWDLCGDFEGIVLKCYLNRITVALWTINLRAHLPVIGML